MLLVQKGSSLAEDLSSVHIQGAVILNPGLRDGGFLAGIRIFSSLFCVCESFNSNFYGVQIIYLEEILDEVIDRRLKENFKSIWK